MVKYLQSIIVLILFSVLFASIVGCSSDRVKNNLNAVRTEKTSYAKLGSVPLIPSITSQISKLSEEGNRGYEKGVSHDKTSTLSVPPQSPYPPRQVVNASMLKLKVKGIYVSAWCISGSKYNELLELMDTTDLNAMVIDVKNDSGQVTYPSAIPLVTEIGANSSVIIPDIKAKLQQLKDKHIYTIARVVAFKDPYLSSRKSDYAIYDASGRVWRDHKGIAWVDPYKVKVWDYNLQIAKEAIGLGFDEIQFDYVRFPENGKKVDQAARFENPLGWSKAEAIEAFLKRAREQIGSTARLSADVFGLTTSSNDDMGIGQDWSRISKQVDAISPMLYPSHYSSGIYGVKTPDLQPYAIIGKAVADAKFKNEQLVKDNFHAAGIRPWYQDFTAIWVKPHKTYGTDDVREQIKAAKEQGIEEFLLWNSKCTYSYH